MRRLDSRELVLTAFLAVLIALILPSEASADFGASIGFCFGSPSLPGARSLSFGGPGVTDVDQDITLDDGSNVAALASARVLTGSSGAGGSSSAALPMHEIGAVVTTTFGGSSQLQASADINDTLLLSAPVGTPMIQGDMSVRGSGVLLNSGSIFAFIISPGAFTPGQTVICQDNFSSTGSSGLLQATNVTLDCSFTVRPNRFFADHVEFHLPFEVRVIANLIGRGSEADFIDVATVSALILTPDVTFTTDASVFLTQQATPAPEPATLWMLTSTLTGLAVRAWRRRRT